QLLQDALHLGEDFLALLAQALELDPILLHRRHAGLERLTLLAEGSDRFRRLPHRPLQVLQPFRKILCHHALLISAPKRARTSATIVACKSVTSRSVSEPSRAWYVRLNARLRLPRPTWSPS